MTADLSRREFLAASAAAGFALAVQPVSATAISTDASGLEAGEVKVPVSGRSIAAYRAAPQGKTPRPVILVVQEIFGLHEYLRDVCRRLAKRGYLAIAPDLYARYGDPKQLGDIQEIAKLVAKVPDAEVMADLDSTVAWATKNGGDTQRLGITGFCWGGRITWLYCTHDAAVKAGVAWYGRLVGQTSALTPKFPLDIAASLRAPVLGLYGGADTGIPIETVEQMRAALKAAGSSSEIVVYPDAPHGFHADYRPSFRQDAAEDGWRRMLEWFQRYGVDPDGTTRKS